DVITVSAPYEYRFPGGDFWETGTEVFATELERTIETVGPRQIMGFLMEPIIGSSAGASLPPKGYGEAVQTICHKYGIPILADEVLVGVGRTGDFFASPGIGLEPDVLILGKGLNGGYAALSALMVRQTHVDEI